MEPRLPHSAKVISVIETEADIGMGVDDDPCRRVKQYWSLEGKLLATCDKWAQEQLRNQ